MHRYAKPIVVPAFEPESANRHHHKEIAGQARKEEISAALFTARTTNMSSTHKILILYPFCGIFVNILPYAKIILFVSYDMVVK